MSPTPECGGEPVTDVTALALAPGISLTLVRSEKGYCFCAWSRHDGDRMPDVSDEHRLQAFPTLDEAVAFFRDLFSSAAPLA